MKKYKVAIVLEDRYWDALVYIEAQDAAEAQALVQARFGPQLAMAGVTAQFVAGQAEELS